MFNDWTAIRVPVALVLCCLTGIAAAAAPPSTAAGADTARAAPASPAPRPAAGRTGKSARSHRAHPTHVTKGPPPPTWTIRPRHHQTPFLATDQTDGDPTPWNARWGCASPAGSTGGLGAAIGITDDDLRRALARSQIAASEDDAACVPYSVLTRDDGSVLGLAVVASEAAAPPRLVMFSRETEDGPFVLRTEAWSGAASALEVVTLSVGDLAARAEAAAGLPDEVAFEAGGLIRALLADVDVADPDALRVRLVLGHDAESGLEHLESIDLLDPAGRRSLREALWVARSDVPGGYFTPNGESLEPVFWTNPVAFRYISRGVGAASLRRRAASGHARRGPPPRKTGHGMHIGVDFVAPTGTPAVSVADGTVLFMGYFGGYGNLVIVEHPGGYTTHFGHLSAFAPGLAVGSRLARGTTLGYVGATGLATGSHLHFEIRHEGSYVDPLDQAQPVVLWSLRRADYTQLARQILVATIFARTPESRARRPESDGVETAPAGAAE